MQLSKKYSLILQTSLAVGVVLTLIAYFISTSFESHSIFYTDFGKFYQSSRWLFSGRNPYAEWIALVKLPGQEQLMRIGGDLNPPFFQLLWWPFHFLTYSEALWVWTSLSIFTLFLSVSIMPEVGVSKIFILFALAAYFPTYITIVMGQCTLLLLPLVILAWRMTREEKWYSSGVVLGILTALKLYFGIFGLYFLFRGKTKALIIFVIAALICFMLPFFIFGKVIYTEYFQILKGVVWYDANYNASILGFLSRVFGGHGENIPLWNQPKLAHGLYIAIFCFTLLAAFFFCKPNQYFDKKEKLDLDFSFFLTMMLFLSPLGWNYYFPFLVVTVITIFHLSEKTKLVNWINTGSILALLLSCYPDSIRRYATHDNLLYVLLTSEMYFYALALWFSILFYIRFSQKERLYSEVLVRKDSMVVTFYVVAFLISWSSILQSTGNLSKPLDDKIPVYKLIRIDHEYGK